MKIVVNGPLEKPVSFKTISFSIYKVLKEFNFKVIYVPYDTNYINIKHIDLSNINIWIRYSHPFSFNYIKNIASKVKTIGIGPFDYLFYGIKYIISDISVVNMYFTHVEKYVNIFRKYVNNVYYFPLGYLKEYFNTNGRVESDYVRICMITRFENRENPYSLIYIAKHLKSINKIFIRIHSDSIVDSKILRDVIDVFNRYSVKYYIQIGYVNLSKFSKFLKQCDIVVLVSEYECGIAQIPECIACNCIPIVSSHSCMVEYVNKLNLPNYVIVNGNIVGYLNPVIEKVSYNISDFINKLEYLLDYNIRKEVLSKASSKIEEFEYRNIVKKYLINNLFKYD